MSLTGATAADKAEMASVMSGAYQHISTDSSISKAVLLTKCSVQETTLAEYEIRSLAFLADESKC